MSKNVASRSDWLLTSEVFPHEIMHIWCCCCSSSSVRFFSWVDHPSVIVWLRSLVRFLLLVSFNVISSSCSYSLLSLSTDRQTYWRTDGVVVLIIRMTFFFTAWISFCCCYYFGACLSMLCILMRIFMMYFS